MSEISRERTGPTFVVVSEEGGTARESELLKAMSDAGWVVASVWPPSAFQTFSEEQGPFDVVYFLPPIEPLNPAEANGLFKRGGSAYAFELRGRVMLVHYENSRQINYVELPDRPSAEEAPRFVADWITNYWNTVVVERNRAAPSVTPPLRGFRVAFAIDDYAVPERAAAAISNVIEALDGLHVALGGAGLRLDIIYHEEPAVTPAGVGP